MLVGVSNDKNVKLITSFSKTPNEAIYKPFIDRKTGKIIDGMQYWKPLSEELAQYINHKEHKLEGETGVLQRRHIVVDNLNYIGKEANNIEEVISGVDRLDQNYYYDKNELKERLLMLSIRDAEKLGIKKITLMKIKKE
jgi:hypothetical protein